MKYNLNEINKILEKYNFTSEEKDKFISICKPIFEHDEFQRRMNAKEYPHHGNTALGDHILQDAAVTYILAKQLKEKGKNVNEITAILTAMFHDLYELPWQNIDKQESMFVNKHGFIHPLEGVVNSATWYPEYFREEDTAKKIIDGVVHHMYPFPVRSLDGTNAELNNYEKYIKLPENIRNLLVWSSNRKRINHVSLCRSQCLEGKIMSTADKIVAIRKEGTGIKGFVAFITGKNSELEIERNKKL